MIIGDEAKIQQWFAPPKPVEPEFWDPSARQTDAQFVISIIVPTKNESGNIEPLLFRIAQATKGIPTEVVFVDDSSDDTPQVIRGLQNRFSVPIALIARPPERRGNGLGGAVVEGFHIARAPWVCVMDADLQHPPELIPQLMKRAEETHADIVVGSRLARGGNTDSLGWRRSRISHTFAMVARATFPVRLRNVTDPLSGLFLARLEAIDISRLQPDGFKILLAILVQCPNLRVAEIPIQFGHRNAGQSKASQREVLRFFYLMLRLRLAGKQQFARFLLVGASGLLVNSLVLAAFTEFAGLHYLLSATVATQASTLWNFGLTEVWVFGKRQAGPPFLRRLVSFWLMNNLLLLLRGPLLTFMVSRLGVHYLLSNFISLLAITVLRYLVADRWIWKERVTARAAQRLNLKPMEPAAMNPFKTNSQTASSTEHLATALAVYNPFIFAYDIHGIVRVASMFPLPELEYFRVASLLEAPDIRLRLERRRRERRHAGRSEQLRRFRNAIDYSEVLGRFGFKINIAHKEIVEVAVSPIIRQSPHVLYTNVVEPILRWTFVRKGYALVHAACVVFGGRAVLVTARTDTGKTSTILRAVDKQAGVFLSDDMTIVSRDGQALSYPKPLTISNHTLQALNGNTALSFRERLALQIQSRLHSRSGRRIGLRISESMLPAATMNAVVQMLIPPPKYMVHRLIPRVTYADQAVIAGAVIIERGSTLEEKLTHDLAVEVFVRNAEDAYGFPPYPYLANSLSQWNGEDLHERERAIIHEVLAGIPTVRLRDPQFNWWQRLPGIVETSHPTVQFAGASD
jgi:dolichol-phosphate mannosyltransferase